MASHVVVTDSTLRRAKVPVTPNTYLSDVLEETCKKLGIKDITASSYGLKHNGKTVDLSIPFRQSGLPPGAKLELALLSKSPTVATICLRIADPTIKGIPPAGLEEKFKSTTTLWQVLRVFESGGGNNFNFTARGVAQTDGGGASGAGQIYYETPVLNVMGRELASFQDFQKTLAQMGMANGRFMLRLSFRKTTTPLNEAMATIQEFFQIDEPVKEAPAGVESQKEEEPVNARRTGDTPMPDASSDATADSATVSSQVQAENTSEEPSDPSHRPITVYSAPTSTTPRAALIQEDESVYEPTIAHAQQYQARLKENSHNKRLLSDAEEAALAAAKAQAKKAVTSARIRVKFPDASIIQFDVTTSDSGQDVYEQVRRVIAVENAGFALKFTNHKGALAAVPRSPDVKVIQDLGFDKGMMVHFLWDENATDATKKGPVLKQAYVQKAQEFQVPTFKEEVEEQVEPKAKVPEKKSTGGAGAGKGMPKWFKGFKK